MTLTPETEAYVRTLFGMADLDPDFISYQSLMDSKTPGMKATMEAMQVRADEAAIMAYGFRSMGIPDAESAPAVMGHMRPIVDVFMHAGMSEDEVLQVVMSMFAVGYQKIVEPEAA